MLYHWASPASADYSYLWDGFLERQNRNLCWTPTECLVSSPKISIHFA